MEDVAWLFARQACSNSTSWQTGLLQAEKRSAGEEVLGLGATETSLLRPISRPGRHLIRMVCNQPPNRTNRPCRSMRKCPRPRELNWASLSADPPLFRSVVFAARPQQAFKKGKGIQNAASCSKRPGELAPAAVQLGTLHDAVMQSRHESATESHTNQRITGELLQPVVSHLLE
jgi:hypothetical protein